MEGLLYCEFLVRSWREWKDKGKGLLSCKLLVRMSR